MTNNFKYSLIATGLVAALLFCTFLWLRHKIERVISIPSVPGHVGLAPDERELVTFNEKTHRVVVETSSGIVKMYARNPTVRIKKDGRVVVDRHLFGLQSRLLLGGGYSDSPRLVFGYEPIYWGPFDASVCAGATWDRRYVALKPYAAVGYNFYGNASMNVGVNPGGVKELDFIVFMSVKI